MDITVKQDGAHKYVEVGEGEILLLLHGLFGALSNFEPLIAHFSTQYKVVVPLLPILEVSAREATLETYVAYVDSFVEARGYTAMNVLGNSLGGHITLLYVLQRPERVKTMVLTGSSGLFESAMGATFPKRGDYEFIRERTAYTFYNPSFATKELVDEVFNIVNDRAKAINIIATAKSAIRHNLGDKLHDIDCPTLLIWGNQDVITPSFVGADFQKAIAGSELHYIDKCGHAPMMEQPEQFNAILAPFLALHNQKN